MIYYENNKHVRITIYIEYYFIDFVVAFDFKFLLRPSMFPLDSASYRAGISYV